MIPGNASLQTLTKINGRKIFGDKYNLQNTMNSYIIFIASTIPIILFLCMALLYGMI
jgi:hypothetical protein